MADRNKVKTLLCLLHGLQGRETTIDLRNEVIVRGTISDVDNKMKYDLIVGSMSRKWILH